MTTMFSAPRPSRVLLLAAIGCLLLATCSPAVSTVRDTRLTDARQEADSGATPLGGQAATAVEGEAGGTLATAQGAQPPPLPEGVGTTEGDDAPPADQQPGRQGGAAPPADETDTEPVPEDVTAQRPSLRVENVPADATEELTERLREHEAVARATTITVGDVAIAPDGRARPVEVAAVDWETFREFTPQVTAEASAVWERIRDGDAAFVHDVGHRLELELGERLPAAGHTRLRVGAFASNGAPPIADAIVSRETAQDLELDGEDVILVAVEDEGTAPEFAEQLESATGLPVEVLEAPETQRAFLSGSDAQDAFEPFSYVSLGDGMIQMDKDWVSRNIVRAEVPIFRGHVVCHRKLIPQLRGALQEIKDRELDHLIDPSQYGGCWVPRHIMFNPHRGLSMHAWGLAVDFNVSTNMYGATPQMDPRIVEVFDKWGFVWGGRWSTPDGMHFELGALLQESPN